MLEIDALDVHYGRTQVLWNVSMHVGDGEIVALSHLLEDHVHRYSRLIGTMIQDRRMMPCTV